MNGNVILLHGALGSSAQMRPLADLLNGPSSCPDLHGHGALSADARPYSIEGFAQEIVDAVTTPVHLVGYSMGGYIALYLAARFPDKVRSVTTIATKFAWTPEGAAQEVRMLNPEKVREKVSAFAAQLESRHRAHWPQVMERTAQLMLSLGNAPVLTPELLASVKCPVKLMRGSDDNMVGEEETIWAEKHIPNAHYLNLQGQPHPMDRMDLRLIVDALRK